MNITAADRLTLLRDYLSANAALFDGVVLAADLTEGEVLRFLLRREGGVADDGYEYPATYEVVEFRPGGYDIWRDATPEEAALSQLE